MKSGARRFIFGIEGLTALVIGASALAAIVSFLVLWLVVSDARTTLESASYSRAEYISLAMGTRPTQSLLESTVSSSIPGGGVKAVAVTLADGRVLAYPSISRNDLESADVITYSSSSGYDVSLLMELPPVLGESTVILLLLGVFAAVLTAIAIMVPSFLRKSVLDPLRGILGEADRFESGGGNTAMSAKTSFRKLVLLLKERDSQLYEMRTAALQRADTAESRNGAVLEAMGSAVVVVDVRGNLSLWNRKASDLFSLENAGKKSSFPDYLAPWLLNRVTEWDKEQRGRVYRFKLTRGEGEEHIVLVTDVTEERRLAEESALADLGALSGGVAHEIGNALCALDGFIELLGRGAGSNSQRTRNILDEAALELDSAKKMVESFRNLAQQNAIEKTMPSAIAIAAIEEICENKSVKCRVKSDPVTKAFIPGGEILVRRIMENLLSNALRFSPAETVEVQVTDSIQDHVFIFLVSDGGPGLPEPPEQVFRPMYTTAEAQGGMGLGLTITRRLVRAMGGSISARNRQQGGAVFAVAIPHEEIEQ